MFLILFLLAFITHLRCEDGDNSLDSDIEGYYWRDYFGYLPHDAVPGGIDEEGRPTYIGQGLHITLIIPGEIIPSKKTLNYAYSYKAFAKNTTVKVLCSRHLEQMEWIPTNNQLVKSLTNKHLIVGGYEIPLLPNYIGRKQVNNTLIIGKIKIVDEWWVGMHAARNMNMYEFSSYEILAYNPYIQPKKAANARRSAFRERTEDDYRTANQEYRYYY